MASNPYAAKYPLKATVFCSGNPIEDPVVLEDARVIAEYMGKEGIGLVYGGSKRGMMGEIAERIHDYGGELYSIGLHRYEPEPSKAVGYYEGYDLLWERQKRLIELGDVYVALPGGLGTLSEIIDIHLIQQLGEVTHPLILVGEYLHNYQVILDFIKSHKLMYDLPDRIIFAKDGKEAVEHLKAHFKKLREEGYVNKTYYPALAPEKIFESVKQNQNPYHILFEGLIMNVLPNVYPSNRFRSSRALAQVAASLAKGKRVADLACGPGVMGLVSAAHGAEHVVQVDINPAAVENARLNAKDLGFAGKMDIYEGDMFEPLAYRYQRYFDIMFFNPPFHRDADAYKNDKLMYAFYGHGNAGGAIDNFLLRAKEHLAPGGKIVIVFSNKDPEYLAFLEESFARYDYDFELSVFNADTGADTRLYTVTTKTPSLIAPSHATTMRLGAVLAQSGVARNDGEMMRRGIDMALEELKKRGMQIEFGTGDDESSERGATIAVADMLHTFKPDAIIGPTWSTLIDPALPVLNESGVTFFTPATSSELLGAPAPERLSGAYNDTGKTGLITNFFKEYEVKSFAYVRRENRWGTLHSHLCADIAKQFELSYSEHVLPAKVSGGELGKLAASLKKTDAILIDNYDDFFYDLMALLKKQKSSMPILCTVSISDALRVELKKLNLLNPVYLIDADIPESFREKYYHAYGNAAVHRYAFNAYAGTHILAQAMTAKSEGDSLKEEVLRMRATIEGETFSYAPNGDLIGSRWTLDQVPL